MQALRNTRDFGHCLLKTLMPSNSNLEIISPRLNNNYRPIEREVCKDVKMRAFTEKCEEEPVQRPYVDCGTQMMPLSLKDICVKIDFQLPRQDCKLEKRQECR